MSDKTYIKVWDWDIVWGRYWLPYEIGIVLMFKRSLFAFGFEFIKYGLLVFIGPFTVGIGTVEEEERE